MDGWAGYRLATKLKLLKIKLKEWAKEHFGEVKYQKFKILAEIQSLDGKEEPDQLSREEEKKRLDLKEELQRNLRKEEIRWKQRSRCNWLKEGDKNTKFFHGMASSKRRANRIVSIMDGRKRLEKKEEIKSHIIEYFQSLYTDGGWERPHLGNIAFEVIGEEEAKWLERNFEEEEVRQAIFDLARDKAPGQMVFRWPSFNASGR